MPGTYNLLFIFLNDVIFNRMDQLLKRQKEIIFLLVYRIDLSLDKIEKREREK
jgi:hypothetical protein